MKIIDTLSFHLEINFIINLSIKLLLYIFLLILIFRSLKNIRIIKPWLLILIILSRFIPHQTLSSDSASDTYIYYNFEKFMTMTFYLGLAIISYVKFYLKYKKGE